MRKLWIIVLMLCLLVSIGSIDTFSLEPINFTLEEQNYMDSNPVLTLAVDPELSHLNLLKMEYTKELHPTTSKSLKNVYLLIFRWYLT